jgi:hypothetical protein
MINNVWNMMFDIIPYIYILFIIGKVYIEKLAIAKISVILWVWVSEKVLCYNNNRVEEGLEEFCWFQR